MDTLKRGLPLYKELSDRGYRENNGIADQPFFHEANPGLYFDKFIDTWDLENKKNIIQAPGSAKNDSDKLKQGSKRAFLEEIIEYNNKNTGNQNLTKPLALHHKRMNDLHDALFAQTSLKPKDYRMDFKTDWRFVSGLGNGHPFESGFIWHRTLGVPYLPGSSVKGMIRAWAAQWLKNEHVNELLGPENVSDETSGKCGKIIIFDAIPNKPPKLELDILNPHYGPYYEDPSNPPADYYNPVPVFFLSVVKGAEFSFTVAPRPGAYKQDGSENNTISKDLDTVKDWLCKALENIGCGGKTAVGYGLFNKPSTTANGDTIRWENAKVQYSQGTREITAYSEGKKAHATISNNENLKHFVDSLSNRRKKDLTQDGIRATVMVAGSGNHYTILSIEKTG